MAFKTDNRLQGVRLFQIIMVSVNISVVKLVHSSVVEAPINLFTELLCVFRLPIPVKVKLWFSPQPVRRWETGKNIRVKHLSQLFKKHLGFGPIKSK